jgi:hypothetical protein
MALGMALEASFFSEGGWPVGGFERPQLGVSDLMIPHQVLMLAGVGVHVHVFELLNSMTFSRLVAAWSALTHRSASAWRHVGCQERLASSTSFGSGVVDIVVSLGYAILGHPWAQLIF